MGRRRPKISTETADAVVGWFPRYLTHAKGRWAGAPFALADWQADGIIRPLFGTLGPDGKRQYRTALIGTPRKAGKSMLGAGVALRLLFRDGEPGAEVYSAASDREQAGIVFEMARSMVEASPALSSRAKVYRRSIVVPSTGASYKVLSADAFTKHGLNPHGVVFDELHTQPNRELWDVLTTGQGARRQPLTVAITTAGFDTTSICYELFEYGRQIEAGVLDDPSFFFRWWGADADADWQDEQVWERAHPGLGISVDVEFLRSEARQARNLPARENTFRTLYLNQWVRQQQRFLPLEAWDASAGIVDEMMLEGRECVIGLSFGPRGDVAAYVLDFTDGDTHTLVWRFFVTQADLVALDQRLAGRASVWAREGMLTVTEGNDRDYAAIRKRINEDAERFTVSEIAFSRHDARQLAQQLGEDGFEMVQMSTGVALAAATQEWEQAVINGRYMHGGHPVARWQVDGLAAKTNADKQSWPVRALSADSITGPQAALMALDRRLRGEPTVDLAKAIW